MDNQDYSIFAHIDPASNRSFAYTFGVTLDSALKYLNESCPVNMIVLRKLVSTGIKPISKTILHGLDREKAKSICRMLNQKLIGGDNAVSEDALNLSVLSASAGDFDQKIYSLHLCSQGHLVWDSFVNFGCVLLCKERLKLGDKIHVLKQDDIFCTYLDGYGYVGIGKVLSSAQSLEEVPEIKSALLSSNPGFDKIKSNDPYVLRVDWLLARPKEEGIGWRGKRLFGSLEIGQGTLQFIEKEFDISFKKICA